MSKYIIELDDRIKLVTSVGVTENGVVYTTSDYVHNLEELNSDYINENFGELQETAYQKGLEEGKKAFDLLDAERDAEYKRGLDDAWEVARKIALGLNDGGFSTHYLKEVFGSISFQYAFKNYSASEAIEKLKAYEEKTGRRFDIDKILEVMKE